MITTEQTEETLASLGFEEIRMGEYLDDSGQHKIIINDEGIYAYTVDRCSAMDDQAGFMEMHLNFIPEDQKILAYLIKRVFYL